MTSYRVTYGYRDVNDSYSIPTHFDQTVVEADSEHEAQLAATDKAYRKHAPDCSHVATLSVVREVAR